MIKISVLLRMFLLGIVLMLNTGAYAIDFLSTALPCTLNVENGGAIIKIDGDNVSDYEFRYRKRDSNVLCQMRGFRYYDSPSGELGRGSAQKLILTEYVAMPDLDDANQGALTANVEPFCRIMRKDELVGPDTFYGDDVDWFDGAVSIYESGFNPEPADNSLNANSYEDGVMSGYIGLYFDISGQMHYGWINVEIGPGGEWVVLKSSGYEPLADTPIPAGLNDPYAVPVPFLASILGFSLIGAGAFWRSRKRKK
ncbi:MAG TPA: hypothetical protein PLF35_12750 [Prolixibacteraceae bacterium]|nr:hypothetical protein [Prolixibacteraceae bacterium]